MQSAVIHFRRKQNVNVSFFGKIPRPQNLVIIFFGEREKLRNLYKTADVGLFPIGGQGGVLAPLEMGSAGVPVIISENMETASLFKKENLGIVARDYGSAILEIYKNKEKCK